MAPSASTVQEANPKVDTKVPRAIQLVMAMSGASPTLTIGEQLRKMRVSRDLKWITAVVPPSIFIVITVLLFFFFFWNKDTSGDGAFSPVQKL
ncbi:hypothetical protein ZWY2020_015991 [Hordeum vulgare]|nr:hypothetical protein ZWY2020_015991 [Hordeum vulgare]